MKVMFDTLYDSTLRDITKSAGGHADFCWNYVEETSAAVVLGKLAKCDVFVHASTEPTAMVLFGAAVAMNKRIIVIAVHRSLSMFEKLPGIEVCESVVDDLGNMLSKENPDG